MLNLTCLMHKMRFSVSVSIKIDDVSFNNLDVSPVGSQERETKREREAESVGFCRIHGENFTPATPTLIIRGEHASLLMNQVMDSVVKMASRKSEEHSHELCRIRSSITSLCDEHKATHIAKMFCIAGFVLSIPMLVAMHYDPDNSKAYMGAFDVTGAIGGAGGIFMWNNSSSIKDLSTTILEECVVPSEFERDLKRWSKGEGLSRYYTFRDLRGISNVLRDNQFNMIHKGSMYMDAFESGRYNEILKWQLPSSLLKIQLRLNELLPYVSSRQFRGDYAAAAEYGEFRHRYDVQLLNFINKGHPKDRAEKIIEIFQQLNRSLSQDPAALTLGYLNSFEEEGSGSDLQEDPVIVRPLPLCS